MTRRLLARAAAGVAICVATLPTWAGEWHLPHAVVGPVEAQPSGPPSGFDAPYVAANRRDHALLVWTVGGEPGIHYSPVGVGAPGGGHHVVPAVPGISLYVSSVVLGDDDVGVMTLREVRNDRILPAVYLSVRLPGGQFDQPTRLPARVRGAGAAVSCDGTITMSFVKDDGGYVTRLPGSGESAPGSCDGLPGGGSWEPAVRLTPAGVSPGAFTVQTNAAGQSIAAWQDGPQLQQSQVEAATRQPGGDWTPAVVLTATGTDVRAALDDAGNAGVTWTRSDKGVGIARRLADTGWLAPETLSVAGAQGAVPVTGAPGRFFLKFVQLDFGSYVIWTSDATGDQPWSPPQRVTPGNVEDAFGSLVASRSGSVVTLIWEDARTFALRAADFHDGLWSAERVIGSPVLGTSQTPSTAAGGHAALASWIQGELGGVPTTEYLMLQAWY